MIERYRVEKGSQSGHCCFEAAVIDTQRAEDASLTQIVCECLCLADAEIIATALNRAESEAWVRRAD